MPGRVTRVPLESPFPPGTGTTRMRSPRSLSGITAALAASALFFAACGDDDDVNATAVDDTTEDTGDELRDTESEE